MLSRRKVEEPSVETVESLTTEIDALDEALTETGQARAGAQAELGETNELGRRAELREIIARAEATIADGRARLDHLRCVRDRLAMERELAKLDPIREKIEEGEEESLRLRSSAAAVESSIAEAKLTLADAEEAIRNPNPQLSSAGRWVADHLRAGGGPSVDAAYRELPRAEQRLIRKRLEGLNRLLPDEFERQRQRARASFDEAGITPVGFPESEREITSYPVPPETPSPPSREPPYPKVG
jgi:chromosome segregation ATPase